MPHLTIEASPALLDAIDWNAALAELHHALAAPGWAVLDDLKSRVHPIAWGLCGRDAQALQLIATLTLTNPRPEDVCQQMARTVLEHLTRRVEALAPQDGAAPWTQCCVFLQPHDKARYFKQQWHPPAR